MQAQPQGQPRKCTRGVSEVTLAASLCSKVSRGAHSGLGCRPICLPAYPPSICPTVRELAYLWPSRMMLWIYPEKARGCFHRGSGAGWLAMASVLAFAWKHQRGVLGTWRTRVESKPTAHATVYRLWLQGGQCGSEPGVCRGMMHDLAVAIIKAGALVAEWTPKIRILLLVHSLLLRHGSTCLVCCSRLQRRPSHRPVSTRSLRFWG